MGTPERRSICTSAVRGCGFRYSPDYDESEAGARGLAPGAATGYLVRSASSRERVFNVAATVCDRLVRDDGTLGDACGGLPAGPVNGLTYCQAWNGKSLRFQSSLSVRHGGPAFRIKVRTVLFDQWQRRIGCGDLRTGDIEVACCWDGKQLQVLPILSEQRIDFGASFHTDDIDSDGYLNCPFSRTLPAGLRAGRTGCTIQVPVCLSRTS